MLDSGLYHCLSDQQRALYAAALHRVTLPGAQLHLFCFSDTDGAGIRMSNQVPQGDLRHHRGRHWEIRGIEPTRYTVAFSREFLERGPDLDFPGFAIDPATLRTDERGRVLVPMWRLHATRRDLQDSRSPVRQRQGAMR